jgi:ArsR family transcriptional regulator, arsenate/arsenite/antimonite-responsive transcriptional repressor
MDTARKLAEIMKVLSVEPRVRIVQLLKERCLCVNALAARLYITQGAVSQHLRVMRSAGLVIDTKAGNSVHYRLDRDTLALWQAEIGALLTWENRGFLQKHDHHDCNENDT